ncbi:MAG: UDP-forming cellulose synthase catalytic subunit [Proteobacteria bacterium]|nr:UDP-forming cellulose synthase catalytic subunit [Pseudomonadota bacterium]
MTKAQISYRPVDSTAHMGEERRSRDRQSDRYKFGKINEVTTRLLEWYGWEHRYWRAAAMIAALLLFLVSTSVSLSLPGQALYAGIVLALALYLRRYTGTLFTLIMIVFSVNASSRYLYWRYTETLSMGTWLDTIFSVTLIIAEVYAWLVLLLGYAQTIWPLRRLPEPLPEDTSLWPTVDILVPTYNEDLKVVRPTILAALSLDWPKEKINICLLDDGRRDEFREFAKSVGVTYLTRDNNHHAKAGNLNEALKKTSGEYVAIFDCDHIPARSFLQMTMGWFLRDKKLGMLQTPHHFLSPDPFERNLGTFRRVPNEGELFYGLIQDGNDLWNATFFCGSCAVTRRSILLEVGGVAVETVTEDAHTALKMHRAGYTTAYISIPQAAGLATESLSIHVGQRIRWARGMAQIFRVDNPLFGKGLSIMQRLCYSNAMLHFFYGLPRLVFLLAPLSYLFFQAHIINASALSIAAYALPHLFHANVTNSRMQGKHRHSFWAELYEATLAWYIFRPTLVALFNPKFGKFNVTAKGGLVEKEFFDWKISEPYLIMLALNVAGLAIGIVRLFWWNTFEMDTVILNLIWTVYNLVILGATIAVATETKQVRSNHRVNCNQKAMLKLSNGRSIVCQASDYSEGGLGLIMPTPGMAPLNSDARVSLFMGDREFVFPAKVVFARDAVVGIEFENLTLQQQMDLVQCTLARADAWLDWGENRVIDRPLAGLKEILYHSMRGYQHLWHDLKDGLHNSFRNKTEDNAPERGLFYHKVESGPDDSGVKGVMLQKLGSFMRMGRNLLVRPGRS